MRVIGQELVQATTDNGVKDEVPAQLLAAGAVHGKNTVGVAVAPFRGGGGSALLAA